MGTRPSTIFNLEQGPHIIEAEVQQPSSFYNKLSSGKHKTLSKILDTRIPTYEQAPFERRVYVATLDATGTGAAAFQARFSAPDGFPSFRVVAAYMWNEATANRSYKLTHYLLQRDGTFTSYTAAYFTAGAGSCIPVVTPTGSIGWNLPATPTTQIAPQFECFQRKFGKRVGGFLGDEFQMVSMANITNADPVKFVVIMESIPDLAEASSEQEGWTVTP